MGQRWYKPAEGALAHRGCRMEPVAGAKLLLLWAVCCGAVGSSGYTQVIEVTNGGPWGDWAWPEMCPEGLFTIGFSIKVRSQV